MIYIGVDGGGTKTALAAYKDGALVAQTKSGAMNYNFIGVARAAEHLIAGVRALTLPPEDIAAIGIGDPSIDDAAPANDNSLTAQFVRQVTQTLGIPVYIRSDAYMTLFALTGGRESAVLMLSGTGAMGIAENAAGQIMVAGGWGRLTGDEGSGYYIATRGIQAALQAADGIHPATALTQAAIEHFGVHAPRELTAVFYGEDEVDVAAFARVVAACAEQGDTTAQDILLSAATYLAAYTTRLVQWSGARRVGVFGSVLCHNRTVRAEYERLLRERHPDIIVTEPLISPEQAAATYAKKAYRQHTPQA